MDKTSKETKKNNALTHGDWIQAARGILIDDGVGGLSLRRIAAVLRATTGAFYWQFENLENLLNDLREDWRTRNSAAFDGVFENPELDGLEKYLGYVRILLREDEYDPKYDSAMRDWAHSCAKTRAVVTEVDNRRVSQLQKLFAELGFNQRSARVRAMMTYFHQSGYYQMNIDETLDERLANIPYYAEIMVGSDFFPADLTIKDLRRIIFDDVPKDDGMLGQQTE
ncbi:TetR/AcrR family transcriptional regulator [Sedimentitalea nanhaiensis]|uniref:Transcriptional regulator, TetR family n=1 Tax=Sedimentitalea nanhaiensis TaxID=999627 RepID=A0A1I7E9X0_9RHOB|nr:TetR/AcrR family transcriptional regulator [Sedimentitalea nanhaiensis]SFU20709.1 transcriptional regulator, TetR family [Sedimentitalea nanhaiensis]